MNTNQTPFSSSYLARFSGIARLYGQKALIAFQQAHICVVGIGGVGSWAAEALARSGVGAITLIDMDDISLSNMNRQLHTLDQTCGELKIEAMKTRILQINPECRVTTIDDFVTAENVTELLASSFDFIIDAVDSVRAKAAMIQYCRRHKKKIITMGAAGGKIDPTQIQIADLAKTIHDPLLAKLRERLKYEFKIVKDSRGKLHVPAVFSTEQLVYPQCDGDVCASKQSASEMGRMNCSEGFGSATVETATFGFVAVAHVLKYLQQRA